MKRTSKYLVALPLAAALLAGCDVSPMGVETVSRNRVMWVDDEREEEEAFLTRQTSRADTTGGISRGASPGAVSVPAL